MSGLRTIGTAILCCIFGWFRPAARAADSPGEPVTVARCAQAPVIDGRLDDACWKSARSLSGFPNLLAGPKVAV